MRRTGRHQIVEIDAAYGDEQGPERLPLHLFFPSETNRRRAKLQPIIYFPGIGVIGETKRLEENPDRALPTLLASTGRFVCWPIYKGTFQRTDGYGTKLSDARKLEYVVQESQDLRRAVDYLANRDDMQMDALTYFGWSWGGALALKWSLSKIVLGLV